MIRGEEREITKKERKNRLYSLIVFMLAIIAIIIIIHKARSEDIPPGPDFWNTQAGWTEGSSQEQFAENPNLTLVNYIWQDPEGKKPTELAMAVFFKSEVVIKAWGIIFKNHLQDWSNLENAIKLENGEWIISKKVFQIEESPRLTIIYVINKDDGQKIKMSFPK
ncbi:MAG: hypothetical protein AAB772_03105 [Patescibacteria group bacterium]